MKATTHDRFIVAAILIVGPPCSGSCPPRPSATHPAATSPSRPSASTELHPWSCDANLAGIAGGDR